MIELPTEAEPVRIVEGDCLSVMPRLPADSFDSIVSDPPYGLVEPRSGADRSASGSGQFFGPRDEEKKAKRRGGFMGKAWDAEVPGVPFWTEAKRVLKPGAYMLVMGGSRTYHRLACAVEDAGFEIRDCLMWIYGSGFPKHKACLKPAYEPILLCRKPGQKSTPLSIDECRIPSAEAAQERDGEATQDKLYTDEGGTNFAAKPGKRYKVKRLNPGASQNATGQYRGQGSRSDETFEGELAEGRWPANLLHDGSEEVMEAFAVFGEKTSGNLNVGHKQGGGEGYGYGGGVIQKGYGGDTGTAARFFYCAKASKAERDAGLEGVPLARGGAEQFDFRWKDGTGDDRKPKCRNTHPTVKPLALMEWLVKLVTPPGACALDPFAGSGTTGKAAANTGRRAVLIEREAAYADIARRRVAEAMGAGLLSGIA